MPTPTEIKTLFAGLRPALKQGQSKLETTAGVLSRMAATLRALDSHNGDILAAADEAGLAAALSAARGGMREVAGHVSQVQVQVRVLDEFGEPVPVLDADGEPVLDEFGSPVYETTTGTETRVTLGFLDRLFSEGGLVPELSALDSPELRAGIAAAAAMMEGGQ